MRTFEGDKAVSGKLLALACALASAAAGQDTIYFERDFPGAVPERFEATLARDGQVLYTEPGEERVEIRVGEEEAATVFEQAAALDYFSKPLASRRKVASTGRKLLRFESAGQVRGEAAFDYSEEPGARDIASWFLKLSETLRHLEVLERAYRFDRLGVNQALVNLEQAYERDRVIAVEPLEIILNKIAQQPRIVHLARARAKGLLESIHEKRR